MIKIETEKKGQCISCASFCSPINKISFGFDRKNPQWMSVRLCGFCCDDLRRLPFQVTELIDD